MCKGEMGAINVLRGAPGAGTGTRPGPLTWLSPSVSGSSLCSLLWHSWDGNGMVEVTGTAGREGTVGTVTAVGTVGTEGQW